MGGGNGVLVVGQIARDLVLAVAEWPEEGSAAEVTSRQEMLGGKGANQAVGLSQLGVPVGVLGVVGLDVPGEEVLDQARADGVDVGQVVRRGRTALLVDITDGRGSRRLFEDVPEDSLLRVPDVATALRPGRGDVGVVCLQAQQPVDALLAVAEAVAAEALVVLDGAVGRGAAGRQLLNRTDVLRLDAAEAAQMGDGLRRGGVAAARRLGAELRQAGPDLVCIEVAGDGGSDGDLIVWDGGTEFVEHSGSAADPTGGGDAFVAGLVAALRAGAGPAAAGHAGAEAARSTVARLGGRPALDAPAGPRPGADAYFRG